MVEIYPSYYKSFKCIANRCEDSCCKDWDVDVDSETEKFYNTVKGELGDKIRRLTVTDKYGERVFINNNGKCPFWNEDMLCDIYIGLGEEHLTRTCDRFPRLLMDFGDFKEHMLSFACPEAARFMLNTENAYEDFGGDYELNVAEQDADYMSFLLKARERTVNIVLDKSIPLAYRLADCLEFNTQVQALLNGEEPVPLGLNDAENPGRAFIFDMHKRFEIMSDTWKKALEIAQKYADSIKIAEDFENDFEKFVLYYIYRYYLEAINSRDVLYSIKRIICAYVVTGVMDAALTEENVKYERLRVLQRYSKEVEHSYDNTEALNREFDADERFEAENLIVMLESF